jgi:upstream activation factor subunit UAF30
MPKVTKSSSETKSTAPVVSAPIVAAPAPAAKAEKNVKAPKVKAESRSVATPAPTPAPVPLATEANAADDAVEVSDDGLAAAFNEAFAKLQQVTTMLSALKTDFRQLEKRATRELKVANKQSAKRRRKSGNRSPSGFVKPTLISPELASFLGKTTGTEMARTEVTREINAYIRKNNLQDKENGRKINPDSNLSKLLKLKADDELTYFNLQRYMSPHFAKTGGKTSETH